MAMSEAKFEVVVPKFDNSGNQISPKVIKEIAINMSNRFGGVSLIPQVLGCWFNRETSSLECEHHTLVFSGRDCEGESAKDWMKKEKVSNCSHLVIKDKEFMDKLSKDTGEKFGQQTIFLSQDVYESIEEVKGERKDDIHLRFRRSYKDVDWFDRLL